MHWWMSIQRDIMKAKILRDGDNISVALVQIVGQDPAICQTLITNGYPISEGYNNIAMIMCGGMILASERDVYPTEGRVWRYLSVYTEVPSLFELSFRATVKKGDQKENETAYHLTKASQKHIRDRLYTFGDNQLPAVYGNITE